MEKTLDISDNLLREAEDKAARDGTTLLALVEQGLRAVVAEPQKPHTDEPYRLVIKPFKGDGQTDEFKDADWAKIRDAIYEGRGS